MTGMVMWRAEASPILQDGLGRLFLDVCLCAR